MRPPRLSELPKPPQGKVGWPWTERSPQLTSKIRGGDAWPRISIVTPSYNQGLFIEETIRSVLLQGYPKLQYILLDGGSTDDTPKVIHRYDRWISYWVSEKDRGQSDALRKGFNKATGEVLGWINADDLLAPSALQTVAEAYRSEPQYGIYAGSVENFTGSPPENSELVKQKNIELMNLLVPNDLKKPRFHQPGIFFTSKLYRRSGGINPKFYYRMDYDLLVRMLDNNGTVYYLDKTLAYFRKHPFSKTGNRSFPYFAHVFQETNSVLRRYVNRFSDEERKRVRNQYLEGLLRCAYYGLADANVSRAIEELVRAGFVGRLNLYRVVPQFIARGALNRLFQLRDRRYTRP